MNLCLFTILPAIAVGMVLQGVAQTDGANSGLIQPHVVHGNEPVYPKIAIAAGVSGKVQLHVAPDGKHVAKIETETGPAMLIKATEDTVRSWEFEKHEPTAFDVTFAYILLNPKGCEEVKGGVVLDLPARVEVSDGQVKCDLVRFKRQQKYLREQHAYAVELHATYNGSPIENLPEVVIANSAQSVTLPVNSGLFLVPEAMATGSDLRLKARIGPDLVDISGIPTFQLESIWNLMLADKTFGEDWPVRKGLRVHSSCILSFDPLDGDGTYMTVEPCRKQVDK